MKYIYSSPNGRPGLFKKFFALVVTLLMAALALMFSAVFLLIILAVGAMAVAYLWWKTRAIRRQIRQMQQMAGFPPRGAKPQGRASQSDVFNGEEFRGEIIEGEAVRVDVPGERR